MAKEQGLSLLDIGPISETVKVGERDGKPIMIDVYGVSTKGILSLFMRFPEVRQWFRGGGIDPKQLAGEAPDAIAAIIAAGCGEPGNEAAEETAGKLPVEAQLDILEAIGRLTFKNGFGPFVKRIVSLAELAQSVNYGRVSATKSPQASKPSQPPGTTTPPSGT
jgi:hypothetical protein